METEAQNILDNLQYIDLTPELNELTKGMDLGEMIHTENFSLYESMSGTELGDPKMDIKQSLEKADTIEKLIKEGRIKHSNDLTNQEVIGIFDEMLTEYMVWQQGHALSHTFYRIGYIFDEELYKDNLILKNFIEAFFYSGSNIFDLTRYSVYLREDDYCISIFSFPSTGKNIDEIKEQIDIAEDSISDSITNAKKRKTKKNIKLNEFDAINCRIQLQRQLLEIQSTMCGQAFSKDIKEKLQKNIKNARVALEEVQKTHEAHSADVSKCKSDSLFKTICCQVSPRKYVDKTKEEGFQMVENMLNLLEIVLDISGLTDFYQIIYALDNFHTQPKNIGVKSFMDVIFIDSDYYFFGVTSLLSMVEAELGNFGLTQEQIQSEKIQNHAKRILIVQQEYLVKHLKNKYRQQREFPKLHQDLSIIIHESSQFDLEFLQKNNANQLLVVQAYDMGLKLMIKQLQLGTVLNLYESTDYPQVLFYQDYLYSILEKNSMNFLSKFDKDFIQAYNNKINLSKKRKKVTDFQWRYFYDFQFNKAIQLFLKAVSRLSYFLYSKGGIQKFNSDQEIVNLFNNRFGRIFNQVYFIKKLDHAQYTHYQEDFWKNFTLAPEEGLTKVTELFKEAQDIFSQIPQNDASIPQQYKQDSQVLSRICVVSSLACFTVKQNIKDLSVLNVQYSNKNFATLPEISVSVNKK